MDAARDAAGFTWKFDFCSASKSGSSLVRSPCVVNLEARQYKISKGFRDPAPAPTRILKDFE